MEKLEICIIAAVASNGAIGKGNSLLWHIREDLQYFKRTTIGCPVIMGRRTYESLGRPLPGRLNIVVSRGTPGLPDGTLCAHSLEEAFAIASESAAKRVFVIGGAQIYALALPYADKLYITRISAEPEDADAFFPELDYSRWALEGIEGPFTDDESSLVFSFETYLRRQNLL